MPKIITIILFCLIFIIPSAYCGEDYMSDIIASKVEKVAGGFLFLEGPVWHKDGFLLFSDVPQNKIFKWLKKNTTEVWRDPSGESNGLTFDLKGRLIACEQGNRRVSRTEKDGSITVIADKYKGKRLNSPNDCVVRSDGAIFFTDPTYGLRRGKRKQKLAFQGVYRVTPGEEPVLLFKDKIGEPNGIAFSPDEKTLFVCDSSRDTIRAFKVKDDDSLSDGKIIARPSFPDGMKVNIKGYLFVTATNGIVIYDSGGTQLAVIEIPAWPANCAFGDEDNKTLFITARTSLYKVRVKIPGVKVWR